MKVIIDISTTQDQFKNRGIGRYTMEIVPRMIDVSSANDHFFLLAFDAPSSLDQVIEANPQKVTRVSLGKLRLSGKMNFLWWRTQYLPAINKLIAEEHPDIYFCPYFWRGFPAKKFPTVVSIHDLILPVLGKYSMSGPILDWVRKFQYHSTLNHVKNAVGVLANSENTKRDLLKFVKMPEDRVQVIYHGLSDWLKPKSADKKVILKYLPSEVISRGYILYYGGAEPNKNVEMVVRGYARLLELHKTESDKLPYLVLGGKDFANKENADVVAINELINMLNIKDRVFYTGFFTDEDALDLLCGAKLFTHLSLYEGFGLSALEPMKCGVPTVASNCSCYPEILGKGALLVDPCNVNAIAEAFYKIISNIKFAKDLSLSGITQTSKYSLEKNAQETYNYLLEHAKHE